MICNVCHKDLMTDAKFCSNCGTLIARQAEAAATEQLDDKASSVYGFDFDHPDKIEGKLVEYFLIILEEKLRTEHAVKNIDDYFRIYVESSFNKELELNAADMSKELQVLYHEGGGENGQAIDAFVFKKLDGLSDYFLIKYCGDLVGEELPDDVFSFDESNMEEVNWQELILRFLQLDKNDEKVYTDFVNMPFTKLQNASQSFLFPGKEEKILLICDQTVFGSCKEGYALTENGLYWKAHFEPARHCLYKNIETLSIENEWINLNGMFFNAGEGRNLKMLKLLKKLKSLK